MKEWENLRFIGVSDLTTLVSEGSIQIKHSEHGIGNIFWQIVTWSHVSKI